LNNNFYVFQEKKSPTQFFKQPKPNRQTFQQIAAILHPDQAQHFQQNVDLFRKRAKAMTSGQDAENPSSTGAPVTNSTVGQPPAQ